MPPTSIIERLIRQTVLEQESGAYAEKYHRRNQTFSGHVAFVFFAVFGQNPCHAESRRQFHEFGRKNRYSGNLDGSLGLVDFRADQLHGYHHSDAEHHIEGNQTEDDTVVDMLQYEHEHESSRQKCAVTHHGSEDAATVHFLDRGGEKFDYSHNHQQDISTPQVVVGAQLAYRRCGCCRLIIERDGCIHE